MTELSRLGNEIYRTVSVHISEEQLKEALWVGMFDRGPAEEQVAEGYKDFLLGFFGYRRDVLDNKLEPDERDLFYEIEEKTGILGEVHEEETLHDGREWRVNLFVLKYPRILELSSGFIAGSEEDELDSVEDLYSTLFNIENTPPPDYDEKGDKNHTSPLRFYEDVADQVASLRFDPEVATANLIKHFDYLKGMFVLEYPLNQLEALLETENKEQVAAQKKYNSLYSEVMDLDTKIKNYIGVFKEGSEVLYAYRKINKKYTSKFVPFSRTSLEAVVVEDHRQTNFDKNRKKFDVLKTNFDYDNPQMKEVEQKYRQAEFEIKIEAIEYEKDIIQKNIQILKKAVRGREKRLEDCVDIFRIFSAKMDELKIELKDEDAVAAEA